VENTVPLTRLTSVQGTFSAHVLQARLISEGFDVTLRGALANPYALTVGDMARIDVFVPADQVEDASYVLLVGEVDAVLEEDLPRRTRFTPVARIVAGALLLGALASLFSSVF
jgi:hypothetical protein